MQKRLPKVFPIRDGLTGIALVVQCCVQRWATGDNRRSLRLYKSNVSRQAIKSMDPVILLAISQGLSALLDIYKTHTQKAKDWVPTAQDIADLLALSEGKSAEDYKIAAAARLGVPWPPVVPADPPVV